VSPNRSAAASRGGRRRLKALLRKETVQIVRDPSALLVAFVLPLMMLLLFAYAISLDVDEVRFGVVREGDGPAARSLAAAFTGTRYFAAEQVRDRREVEKRLVNGTLHGFVVIPADFESRLARSASGLEDAPAPIQIVTDASQPNTANFVSAYAQGVFENWRAGESLAGRALVTTAPRFWFNPELESRLMLLPGAIAIVMTMIGTLLTALVVAREWERGTMEALMSTPASMIEILLGKLLPYFVLGLGATVISAALCIFFFGLPLEGSVAALLLVSAMFLLPALGQGLLISTLARNQFIASQIAMLAGFLPAFLLSGFLFEISSMPGWIRALTHIVPARPYVEALQTIFLAGDIWPQLLRDLAHLGVLGLLFLGITAARSRRSLD
jgi:ABC-2 type transport system permease protein